MSKKYEKVTLLLESLRDKEANYRTKADRAKKPENYDTYYERSRIYSNARNRAFNLQWSLISGNTPQWIIRSEYQYRLERKKERREKFLSTHRYSPWFLQTSLDADYGTFTCDVCYRTFYHSPSAIYKGPRKIYDCCCGTCTNGFILPDHGHYPFS